jgi:N-acetylglucosamine-6-phosphate deacetylase
MNSKLIESDQGEAVGRDPWTGELLRVSWSGGVIDEVGRARDEGDGSSWLVPALFDLQVNGYGGVDYQASQVEEAALVESVKGLARAGCGGMMLTLITDHWDAMLHKLAHLVRLRRNNPVLQRHIRGWHLEGPFLSAEDGFRGAHRGECMRDPKLSDLTELAEIAGQDLVLLTVAPERDGALGFIREAVARGMKVSLGHSAASAKVLQQAVSAGAGGITHLGNGCPQMWPRHDNWFWSVADSQGLAVGLIPDQIHLPPSVFRTMHRALLGRNQIYYTTDAMAAAGAGPGRYSLAGVELEVGEDQVVRQPGCPNFAGSALTPLDGVIRACAMLREPWHQVWGRFSRVPAEFLGMGVDIEPGLPACFCVVTASPEGHLDEVVHHLPSD